MPFTLQSCELVFSRFSDTGKKLTTSLGCYIFAELDHFSNLERDELSSGIIKYAISVRP